MSLMSRFTQGLGLGSSPAPNSSIRPGLTILLGRAELSIPGFPHPTGDWYPLRRPERSLLVLGKPGCGKSTAIIQQAAGDAVAAGAAVVALDRKGDIREHMESVAAKEGRTDDLVVLSMAEDAKWRWNPLGALTRDSSPEEAREVASAVIASMDRSSSTDPYWDQSAHTLLDHIVRLLARTGREVSFASILKLLAHLDEGKESVLFRTTLFRECEAGEERKWLELYFAGFAKMAPKTQQSIASVLDNHLQKFNVPRLRRIFSGRAGDPDQMPTLREIVAKAKILVVDLNIARDRTIADPVLRMLKHEYTRTVLGDRKPEEKAHPTVLLLDEYQQVAHPDDATLLEMGRAVGSVVIAASQQLASIRAAVGGGDAGARIIGSFGAFLVFQHHDPTITEFLDGLVGDRDEQTVSISRPAAGWLARFLADAQGPAHNRATTSVRRLPIIHAGLMRQLQPFDALLFDGEITGLATKPYWLEDSTATRAEVLHLVGAA